MKDFHCRDVGNNCEFVARGEDADEVYRQTQRHAEQVHHMSLTPELEQRIKGMIHDQSGDSHRTSVARNS